MWMTIDKLFEHVKEREMFVAKAFDVQIKGHNYPYTSDPWCVWVENWAGTLLFSRWPHPFPPTHFCLLPTEKEE
jgi:hypothetical protein